MTSKGQVTLRKELLAHLGIQPGQRLEVEVLPNGRLELHTAQATGEIDAVYRLLAGRADRRAARAGLRLLAAGGDFADAVIAFSGRRLGGECFVSFDRRAVQLLADLGEPAEVLE